MNENEKKLNKAPDPIESGMCCEYCLKQETSECPVKTASPWSRWGNYCNEFVGNRIERFEKEF